MRECFLLREECLSAQLGRSRERQLERLDFLDSIDIFIESWLRLVFSSIKMKCQSLLSIAIYLTIPNQNDQIPRKVSKMTEEKVMIEIFIFKKEITSNIFLWARKTDYKRILEFIYYQN